MPLTQTENLNVLAFEHMPSPEEIKARVPLTGRAAASVVAGRKAVMEWLFCCVAQGLHCRCSVVVWPLAQQLIWRL